MPEPLGLVPAPDVPPEFEWVAEQRAKACVFAEKILGNKRLSKGAAWKFITKEFNAGLVAPELVEQNGVCSERTLRRWLKAWLAHDRDHLRALAPSYGAKQTATHHVSEWEEKRLYAALWAPGKKGPASAAHSVLQDAIALDLDLTVSEATLYRRAKEIISEHRDEYVYAHEGAKAWRDKYGPFIERDWSQLKVGDVSMSDGHVLNFLIINPHTGKPKRMNLITFFDVVSRMPIGGYISPTSTADAVSIALRNSIINYGAPPRMLYIDNGREFKNKLLLGDVDLERELGGLYERLGIDVTFAKAYNARAKAQLERWHSTLNNDFCRRLPAYIGACITDKPASMMRNEKWHQKNRPNEAIPYDIACQYVDYYINKVYANTPHDGLGGATPRQVLEANPPASRIDIDTLNYLMLRVEVRKIGRNGILLPGTGGLRYWHDALAGYNKPVLVRYDWHDLRSILVYDRKTGRLICQAHQRNMVHPMVKLSDTPELDGAELHRQLSDHKRLERNVRTSTEELQRRVDDIEGETDYAAVVEAEQAQTDRVGLERGNILEFTPPPEDDGSEEAAVVAAEKAQEERQKAANGHDHHDEDDETGTGLPFDIE